MKEILFHDLTVHLERRDVKNINIYVKPPDGQVLVTAPVRVREARIMEFLESRIEWIEKARERVIERSKAIEPSERTYTEAEKRLLKEKIAEYAAKWEPVLGVHGTNWQVRLMKTRWGSCSVESGRIRINLRLIEWPKECLEYVIVHELCHLLEPNHGPGFHRLLDQHLPDWKERKKKLESQSFRT